MPDPRLMSPNLGAGRYRQGASLESWSFPFAQSPFDSSGEDAANGKTASKTDYD
jgi:hypothetical protein